MLGNAIRLAMTPRSVLAASAILLGALLFVLHLSSHERSIPAQPSARSEAVVTNSTATPGRFEPPVSSKLDRVVAPAGDPSEAAEPLPPEPPRERTEAGVLEVLATIDAVEGGPARPVTGGTVRIALSESVFRTGAPPLLEDDDVVAEQPIDARGEARFQGLETGQWYVEARTPTGATRGASLQLRDDEGRRLVLRFGTSTVHGFVSDPATRSPVAYADLMLEVEPTPKGMFGYDAQRELAELGRLSSTLRVKTGQDGAYRFDELPAGAFSLWLEPTVYEPDSPTPSFIPRRLVRFELEPGERRRFDFPDLDGAIWSGSIRTQHGELVRGDGQHESKLDVRLRGPIGYRQVQTVDESGSFRLHLPGGVHDVLLVSPFNSVESRPFGEAGLSLEAGVETTRDMVLPGTRLAGTVVDENGERLRGQVQFPVGAHLEGETHDAAMFRAFLGADGTFVLDGLGPGAWIVSAGRGSASTPFAVRASDFELSVRIVVP